MLSEEHDQLAAAQAQQPQKKNPPAFADFSQTKLDVHQVGVSFQNSYNQLPMWSPCMQNNVIEYLLILILEQELLVARNSMRRDADAGISPISTVAAIANTVATPWFVHNYRVTIQVVQNLLLRSKQHVCFSMRPMY